MKTFLRAGALALALSAATAPAVLAQAAPPPAPTGADTLFKATTLNLSAYGETRVAPDMATITLGVMTEGKTAAEAMQANAARMAAVMASLRKAGIADRDIQTSNLNLNPQYRYQENQPPLLVGYQASNNVSVTVHDLKRLGAAVDASVSAGANQVNGIAFGLDDPTAAENAAREAAVKALAAKADLYARATGHRISRLVSLSEGGGYTPQPPMPMELFAMAAQAKDAGTSISGGELKVRIDISGLYELTR
ncbi:MAG: SIMPL domain-containing protein [Phenylobacterium sp.]|uniref:SIMPL domain-containing protein n=1 Tax=Phenylobacterium sp. TaxID=1871053 RepID=UPI001A4DB524|nr:SIMPL domain-containing protein [Phenylobacterium sp.]MBL8554002.1 SIMPL domain-containing protein [Phenylobacterium sp.]